MDKEQRGTMRPLAPPTETLSSPKGLDAEHWQRGGADLPNATLLPLAALRIEPVQLALHVRQRRLGLLPGLQQLWTVQDCPIVAISK